MPTKKQNVSRRMCHSLSLLCLTLFLFVVFISSSCDSKSIVISDINNNLNVTNSSLTRLTSRSNRLSNELQAHHDFGLNSPSFMTRFITHMFELFNVKQVIHDIKVSKTTEATCHSCKFGMGLLQHLLQFGRGKEELARLTNTICVSLRIESPRVCKGITEVYKVSLIFVIGFMFPKLIQS